MSQPTYHPVLDPVLAPPFPEAVLPVLRNPQLRKNVAHAIDVIRPSAASWLRKRQIGRNCARRERRSGITRWRILAFTSNSLKSGARQPAEWFTGPRMQPRRDGSFSNCCARRMRRHTSKK